MRKGKYNSCKKCLLLYRLLFILALLLYCASLPAYDYQNDGIYYNISIDTKTAQVTYNDWIPSYQYKGDIVIPASLTINGLTYRVTSIGNSAFDLCSDVTSVSIPSSVTVIGDNAFKQCIGMSSITIPNSVTSIGNSAFRGCSGLTSITISNNLLSIGIGAFSSCSSLISVTIPASVTSIGEAAFADCRSLVTITIPYNVTSIGEGVFQRCTNLTSISVNTNNSQYRSDSGVLYNKSKNRLICYPAGKKDNNYTIPNGVNYIGKFAFYECGYLSNIVIPNSMIEIGEYAFDGCSITSVTIPQNVTSIGSSAFYRCRSLNLVYSEIENPFNIDEYVFQEISANAILQVPQGTKNKYELFSGWTKNFKEIVETGNTMTLDDYKPYAKADFTSWYFEKSWEINIEYSVNLDMYRIKDLYADDYNYYFKLGEITNNGNVPMTMCNAYGTKMSEQPCGYVHSTYGMVSTTWLSESFTGYDSDDDAYYIPFEWTVSAGSFGSGYECFKIKSEDTPAIYTISVKVSGNGSVSYDETTIRNRTTSFTVNEGTYATINFAPDNGYRIKNVKENYYNVTSQVRNNSYTTYISGNTTIEVEFEAIPPTTYSLSIKATGNGSASYDGTTIKNRTSSFTLNEGSNVMITFVPDNGYRIKGLMVNNADETANISKNTYTISNISRNTTVEVVFEEDINAFTVDGVNYTVKSFNEKTVAVSKGNYGAVLEIPAKVTYQNVEWKVTSIESNILSNGSDLCAIIWNPEAAFTENVSNPNLLLYVKSANYAPQSIKNVVVNNRADNITLVDAADGNNFYCPLEFTAKSISYTHHYKMETGINESKGWETIALPFDVQRITHKSKGEIVPFANWKSGDSKKPFWLKQLGSNGWTDAQSIKAYTPYIISMPNNTKYKEEFKLNGDVTFSAVNVKIGKTENLTTSSFNGRTFVPNFSVQSDKSCYALNVNNDYVDYQGSRREGSMFFIGLRDIHPFEAYMTTASGTRAIAIEDDITTGIEEIIEMLDERKGMKVYNLKGQLIKSVEGKTMDEVAKMLPAGVYIVDGQKLIIK